MLSVVIGLVISSAFSAILVYATDLMPGKVGMIAGVFFGLMFGLGGLGSAFFGWLADRYRVYFSGQHAVAPVGCYHRFFAEYRVEKRKIGFSVHVLLLLFGAGRG